MNPVFVHISKNAGTSLIATAGDRITVAGHQTAERWIERNGTDAPLFAIVRDPYDRVVSEYCYRRRRYESGDTDAHLVDMHEPFDVWVRATFDEGRFRTRSWFDASGVPFNEVSMVDDSLIWFAPQTRWLGDSSGRLLVADVLRFESLADDWRDFCGRHGIVSPPLQHLNASPAPPEVLECFDEQVRAIVYRYYRNDFDAFGYPA